MNALYSLLRHIVTAIAALSAYFALYDPAQAQGADGMPLDPLGAAGMTIAVALTRWVLSWVSRGLAKLAAAEGGISGGTWCVIGWLSMAVGIVGSLPSCAPGWRTSLGGVPVKACVATDQGTVCYSSDDGATATVDLRSAK